MVNAIEDNNDDIYNELLGFFSLIQKRMINNDNMNGNLNCENYSEIIQNPIKRRPKGRPKKSDSKRIKSVIENFNTKTQYKCKVCKQEGHNSKTCKEKKLLDIDESDETER